MQFMLRCVTAFYKSYRDLFWPNSVIFVRKEEISSNFRTKADFPLPSLNLRSRLLQFVYAE